MKYNSTNSLTEFTKLTRVEPLTIISKDCLTLDYMVDVNNALLNIFSGYYLQAVSLLTKVNDVEVVRILDKLNPDRDSTGFLLGGSNQTGSVLSHESLHNLVLENYKYSLPKARIVALEAGQSNTAPLAEISNLSVGKMLNVDIAYCGDGDNKASTITIPVNVRLMVSVVPNSTISRLLVAKTEDNSAVERFHSWRAGRISFIKDLIFCQDLIDEHKKANIEDETGTIQEIIKRVNNSKKYGLLTQNPSLVSASNIFVITEEVAKELEAKLGGKLANFKTRQKAFENTYAMLIVVIDREWERVTFYSRGVSSSTDLSIKEIKSANKAKGGIDIADVLKSFSIGSPISF